MNEFFIRGKSNVYIGLTRNFEMCDKIIDLLEVTVLAAWVES